MKVKGVYIFKSDTGINLFTRKMFNIQEELISAFITALKDFFSTFSLGGLSTFASEQYIFYLASEENVSTALIVDKRNKSENYFNVAFEISRNFYDKYKQQLKSDLLVPLPNLEEFNDTIDNIILYSEQQSKQQSDLIKLYEFSKGEELTSINFVSESQLFNLALFVAVNCVTKQIFVCENSEASISNRILYLTNKEVSSLNQMEYKSLYKIRNISDIWDYERLILEISKVLKDESIPIAVKC